MNFFKKIRNYFFPILVLFLLAFIPLYPKLPLVDVQNTWVYVRVEDFLVVGVLGIWSYLLFTRKATLKSPLTVPIFFFWLVGAIATIHGVVIIFPTIADVFPNVALLAFLRHIEYLSLFFVAFSAVKSKKFAVASIWTVISTLLLVVAYGFGQKFLSFPAFLTMNEEYAKGIPIVISPLNRISSTFAGHYDLAAYLVLVLPILASLFFGFKNFFIKIFLIFSLIVGFILLFMTVSRVSFFVLFVGLFFVLLFNKKKLLLYAIPFVILLGGIFFAKQSSLLSRFGNTVSEVDVLVNAKTGEAIGQVKFYPRNYLFDKEIIDDKKNESPEIYLSEKEMTTARKEGIPPNLIPYRLPRQVAIVPATITSTGETLPQGSGYINLSLSPVTKRTNGFFFEYPPTESSPSASIRIVPGDYLVKRASAYDLSFTTRFQGEWPNALFAFQRNVLFGSGYGSVSLAVDNNYYRILGETGLLGALGFISIFIVLGIYIKKVLPNINSKVVRSFILGYCAGVIGLALNAILIDVFEASKVAFQLWILTGIVVGTASLYQAKEFKLYKEIKRALSSPYAVVVYLLIITIVIFSTTLTTYFIGDDFTWFRWAADCKLQGGSCGSYQSTILQYFFNSDGFFYRPGTKLYFLSMYPIFWLNQVAYHAVSVVLHFIVTTLLYFIARKIFKNNLLASVSALLFLIISGYLEIVLWISATGHLFNALFILLSFLLFIFWEEKRKTYLLIFSLISAFVSLLFYELGVITPILMISYFMYKSDFELPKMKKILMGKINILLLSPVVLYLAIRAISHTHWFSGDYSYNLLKLPLNLAGNLFGYLLIIVVGPMTYPFYEKLRELSKSNLLLALIAFGSVAIFIYFIWRKVPKLFSASERRIVIFSILFFAICLIPFLGLGNITFRYSYLASFGIIIIFSLVIIKLYKYLESMGRDIAILAVGTIFSVFTIVHVVQAQQSMIEWKGSGEKVQKFLTSLDSLYDDSWSNKKIDVNLHFAQVPIKNGNAWVFPVGLNDAVWFAFKNEKVITHTYSGVEEVSKSAFTNYYSWVFIFQSDGSLKKAYVNGNGNILTDE